VSIFLKTALTTITATVLSVAATASHADVLLTFDVNNVTQNDCTGAMQPTCINSTANGFTESMRIAAMPLISSDSSFGTMMQTSATYDFPYSRSGTPFTAGLSSRVSNPINGGQAYTQVDSSFDNSAGSGSSDAQIYSDVTSDITDLQGIRTQQEYKLDYNMLANFAVALSYSNLVSDSLYQFFDRYVGTMTGSFDELGTTSSLDPIGLGLAPYAFTEYQGDATLVGVQNVPEPGVLALFLAAFAGMAVTMRARKSGSNRV
jgi:hypothetical protein